MPKQALKLINFHGGLNNNSDPRDLKDNEFAELIDVAVNKLGRIVMLGGNTAHGEAPANSASGFTGNVYDAYGFFVFSSDFDGAEDHGTGSRTSTNYFVIADNDDNNIYMYSTTADAWDDDTDNAGSGVIDVRKDTGVSQNLEAQYIYAAGALRVFSANSHSNNKAMWYGTVYRRRFWSYNSAGSIIGLTESAWYPMLINHSWHTAEAAIPPLAVKGFDGGYITDAADVDSDNPIAVLFQSKDVSGKSIELSDAGATMSSDKQCIKAEVDITASNDRITFSTTDTAQSTTPNVEYFCSVGDWICMTFGAVSANDTNPMKVLEVSSASDPEYITVDYSLTDSTNDIVHIHNLSKTAWFDPDLSRIECAVSTLYDEEKQESELYISDTVKAPALCDTAGVNSPVCGMLEATIDFIAKTHQSTAALTEIPYRVSGWNIYFRRTDGTNAGPWYLQAEVDIEKGIRPLGIDTWTIWESDFEHNQTNDAALATTGRIKSMNTAITYEQNTGRTSSTDRVGWPAGQSGHCRSAVVLNNRAYYGNVSYTDGTDSKYFPDSIIKSDVGKYDSFTSESSRLVVDADDGDNITALAGFGDRLFQFKEKSLAIINVSQSVEFVEEVHKNKGVYHSANVSTFQYGIAWASRTGCYMYDGQKVTDLLIKDGIRVVSKATWDSFYDDNLLVGYEPKESQLILVNSGDGGGNGSSMFYDVVTRSWIKGSAATFDGGDKSNFVNDWNGDLCHFVESDNTVYKWDHSPDSSANIVITTKDFDFGDASARKKIYKVYLTFKGDARNVEVHYGVDGLAPALTFNSITSDTDGSSTGSGTAAKCIAYDAGTTDWLKAELKPSSPINNVNSFQLKISGDGSNAIESDFEINDITIIYRVKNIK
jgi:hypothetical protein